MSCFQSREPVPVIGETVVIDLGYMLHVHLARKVEYTALIGVLFKGHSVKALCISVCV